MSVSENSSYDYHSFFETATLQAPGHVGWVVIGTVCLIANILIVATVFKNTALRSKTMCILASLAVADCLQSLFYILTGAKRLLYYSWGLLENMTQTNCIAQTFWITILGAVIGNLTLILSVDRLLAMAFPIFHKRQRTFRYVAIINLVTWLYSIVLGGLAFLDSSPKTVLPLCTILTSYAPWYQNFITTETTVKVFLIILTYAYAALTLSKRLRAMRSLPEARQRQERQELELGAFRTVVVLVILYMAAGLAVILSAGAVAPLSSKTKVKYGPVFGVYFISTSACHLFVYLVMSKAFRQAFKELFCGNNSAVHVWNGVS